MLYYKLKDETTTDSNALEKKELDRRTNHHGPMKVQIVKRVVEVPQVMTQEVMIPVVRPHPEYVDVQCANPIVQTMEKAVEVPQVQYTNRIVGVSVTAQRRVPTIQTAQRTVEMPPMTEEMDGVPKTVSQDRIPQRTAEQVMDTPVPQVVEELVEVFKVFFQYRVQQRIVEQITETPAVSLAEEIVEAPKVQTQGQVLASQTVQKTVETPQVQFLDRAVLQRRCASISHGHTRQACRSVLRSDNRPACLDKRVSHQSKVFSAP